MSDIQMCQSSTDGAGGNLPRHLIQLKLVLQERQRNITSDAAPPKSETTSNSLLPHSGQVTPSKSGSSECSLRWRVPYPPASRPIRSTGSSVGKFRVLEANHFEEAVGYRAAPPGVAPPVLGELDRFFPCQFCVKKLFGANGFLDKCVT